MEKKIPMRMCIACKVMQPKKTMLRIVKDNTNLIFIDYTGKSNGRGAYICDSAECIDKCIKKRMLNKAFSTSIQEEIYMSIKDDYDKRKG